MLGGYGNTLSSGADYQQKVSSLTTIRTQVTLVLAAGDELENELFIPSSQAFTTLITSASQMNKLPTS